MPAAPSPLEIILQPGLFVAEILNYYYSIYIYIYIYVYIIVLLCKWTHLCTMQVSQVCTYLYVTYACIVRVYVTLLPHSSSPPPPPHTPYTPHTLNSNLQMPSLYSNPIVPEAATRYKDHYKLQPSPPHPILIPAIQLITCYKPHVNCYANSRLVNTCHIYGVSHQ